MPAVDYGGRWRRTVSRRRDAGALFGFVSYEAVKYVLLLSSPPHPLSPRLPGVAHFRKKVVWVGFRWQPPRIYH
jgi:hypothetical protein